MNNRESTISRGRHSRQSNFCLKKAIMYLLMNYSFDTRHAIIMSSRSGPTLGKFSLDHFSTCRRQWPQVLLHQRNLEWIFNNLQFVFQSLAGFRIPTAGFWIPKEKFTDSRIWISLHGARLHLEARYVLEKICKVCKRREEASLGY